MSDLKTLLRSGKKIEAIKLLRRATSLGLIEAKIFIEAIDTGWVDRIGK